MVDHHSLSPPVRPRRPTPSPIRSPSNNQGSYGREHRKSAPKIVAVAAIGLLLYFVLDFTGQFIRPPAASSKPLSDTEKSERRLMVSAPPLGRSRTCQTPSLKEAVDMPSLVSIQRWNSAKPRPDESITLITHLSIDRLPVLENQCITWPDPVAAVVYVPMVANSTGGSPLLPSLPFTTLDDVIRGMDAFHHFMEETAACALYLELAGQFVTAVTFPGAYPINALRNKALALAPTELAIPLDADFLVTPMLGLPGEGYRDPLVFRQLKAMAMQHTAMVLPVLEITNRWQDISMSRNFARGLVIAGKGMARGAIETGALSPYRPPHLAKSPDLIDVLRWAALTEPEPYNVQYRSDFEPCALVSVSNVPWFDERFLDNVGSTSAWFAHLAARNYSFAVHPYAFAVHVPHTRRPFPNRYLEAQAIRREARMDALQKRVISELKQGRYAPVVKECGSEVAGIGGDTGAGTMPNDLKTQNEPITTWQMGQQETENIAAVDLEQQP